jgi:hypothetical protein
MRRRLLIMWLLLTVNFLCDSGLTIRAGDVPSEEETLREDVRGFGLKTLVTACDEGYFESVENLVASIQVYEPDMDIFVYDLGLTADQRDTVSSWAGVSLISIDWTQFPSHVVQRKIYAWKSAVIKDAVERVGSVIWIDAGIELRWDLAQISLDVGESGHWLILEKVILQNFAHPKQYDALGLERGVFDKQFSLAAGMIAVSNTSRAWTTLFLPWHQCSMNFECISPEGSNSTNHRWDQSALSLLMYKNMREGEIYRVMISKMFWLSRSMLHTNARDALDSPRTKMVGTVFYCRRKRFPKPFSSLGVRFKHDNSSTTWSRVRPRFWGRPYGIYSSSRLSNEDFQRALVELSFVEGAFMLRPHPSHAPDNVFIDFVLTFLSQLAGTLQEEAHPHGPHQLELGARIDGLIRRLTPKTSDLELLRSEIAKERRGGAP